MDIKEKIAEIKLKDQEIHSFLEIFDDAVERSQRSRSKNYQPGGLLEGKVVAIKDNLSWQDAKVTAASQILKDFQAVYTATAVQKLIDAGAIIVGKTNLDEFAMGSSTENSSFGPTKNPVNLDYVPGGSSGGSAAAVAASLVWGALGSDTGGSIRQPASYCGVVGFKPTYGTVSRYGLLAMGSSLDVVGPMAKSVADARLIYQVIAGQDRLDSTSRSPHSNQTKITDVKGLKIGLPKEFFSDALDPKIKLRIDDVVEKLKNQGAQIREISLPSISLALAVYYVLMPVEVASNLARFDGIKYGLSVNDPSLVNSLEDVYFKSRSQGFGSEVKRRIILGTYASSAGYADKYYLQASKVRQLIIDEFEDSFKDLDVILTPTAPSLPFKFGEKTADPLTMYLEDIYTVGANIAGLPAISLPIGQIDGLPVGLQLMAPQLHDFKLLDIAQQIEGIYGQL